MSFGRGKKIQDKFGLRALGLVRGGGGEGKMAAAAVARRKKRSMTAALEVARAAGALLSVIALLSVTAEAR